MRGPFSRTPEAQEGACAGGTGPVALRSPRLLSEPRLRPPGGSSSPQRQEDSGPGLTLGSPQDADTPKEGSCAPWPTQRVLRETFPGLELWVSRVELGERTKRSARELCRQKWSSRRDPEGRWVGGRGAGERSPAGRSSQGASSSHPLSPSPPADTWPPLRPPWTPSPQHWPRFISQAEGSDP